MKQNRLNFLQKNLPVLLIALFLTAVPGFIAAMDLETQLGTLQGSLVALKGKLGQLKGGLENIKDVLEGKTLSSGGGSSLSSNPDVADAIQKIDTAFLTTLGVKHGPKTCEAIQNLLKDNELNLIITQIKALSVENTNTVKLLFGHKDFLTTLTKQSISASNAEAILNQGIYLTQVIEALTIENKLITPKASFAPSLTLQSIWGAKNAQFKSKVIGLALSLFFQNQSIKTKQEKFAYIAQLELLEKLKDNANIKTLAKEIAKANKGSVDYPMNLDELKNFEDTNLPKILGDLKYNLEIDTINQVITEITTIANKSTVLAALPAGGAGGPPPIVGMLPAKAPLTPEDFTTLANNADLLSGTSDKKDGFFTEVIKNKIKDKVQKTLKASDKDIVTAGVLADTLETLQQNLGLKKAVSSGADPSPAQPGVKKPVASDPEGYKGIWKNLETSLSNPIAFKNALDKAIAKIADNEKMKKTLNKIPGLHNFLIVMDSTRPQEPIINLLKNKWQPIFEKIIANPAIKTWFIEQMKLDKSIPKQGVVYTGNPDFKETDWDTRANAILAAKAAPAKNSGGFGGGGNSLGGSVASGYKDGMIDTLDLDPEHYKYLWNLPELQNELTQIKEYLNSLFPMGSAYPAPLIDEAVDTIAGAYFEKYVLAQCKWFLNKQDTDRTNSSNNPNWVQEKYFKYIYDALKSNQPYQVDDVDAKNQFIENVLKRTVKRTDTAAKTMFYEPGTSQAVRCQCLPLRILANTEMNTDAAIDKNNPILKPLLYLIYETMHVTLHHDFNLVDPTSFSDKMGPLMKIFDLKKKIREGNKVRFHIGFDKAFSEIIDLIIENEAELEKQLIPRPKDYSQYNEIVRQHSNGIIDTKKVFTDTNEDDEGNIIKNADGSDKHFVEMVFPGGIRSDDQIYQGAGSEDEKNNILRFAVKTYLKYHSPYSVGLVPRDLCEMLELPEEKQAEITEKIAEYTQNKDEIKKLKKQADDFRKIGNVIEKIKSIFSVKKAREGIGFNNEVLSKINALDAAPNAIGLSNIGPELWRLVFKRLAAISTDSTLADDKSWIDNFTSELNKAGVKEHLGENIKIRAKIGLRPDHKIDPLAIDLIYAALKIYFP